MEGASHIPPPCGECNKFHRFAMRRVVLQVLPGAPISGVISTTKGLAGRMADIVFMYGASSNAKFSKSVNSFELSVFFPSPLGLWLRFGAPKSENEFVAPDLYWNVGLVHEVEIFENLKFGLKLKLWHV